MTEKFMPSSHQNLVQFVPRPQLKEMATYCSKQEVVLIYSPTEGRHTNLASISNEQLERRFLCGRKGCEVLMRKSPIRLLICDRSADTHAPKDYSQVGH